MNNDGSTDIVGFGDAGVLVALNNKQGGFNTSYIWTYDFGVDQGWDIKKHLRFLKDMNNDGLRDVVGIGYDNVLVAFNNKQGGFNSACLLTKKFTYNAGWRLPKMPRFLADMDGDGLTDIVGFGPTSVSVYSQGNPTFQCLPMWGD